MIILARSLIFIQFVCIICTSCMKGDGTWNNKGCYSQHSSGPLLYLNVSSFQDGQNKCSRYPYFVFQNNSIENSFCLNSTKLFQECERCNGTCPYVLYSNEGYIAKKFVLMSDIIFPNSFAFLAGNLTLRQVNSTKIDIRINNSSTTKANVRCMAVRCEIAIGYGNFTVGYNTLHIIDQYESIAFVIYKQLQRPFFYEVLGYARILNSSMFIGQETCLSICINKTSKGELLNLTVEIKPDVMSRTLYLSSEGDDSCVCDLVLRSIYLRNCGTYNLFFKGTINGLSYVEKLTEDIVVQERIYYVCFKNSYTATGFTVKIDLNYIGPKKNVRFDWIVNKALFEVTDVPYIIYNLNDRDLIRPYVFVQVNASNLVSFIYVEKIVRLEEDFSTLRIDHPPNPVIVGENASLVLKISNRTINTFGVSFMWNVTYTYNTVNQSNLESGEPHFELFLKQLGTYTVTASVDGKRFAGNATIVLYALRRLDKFSLKFYYSRWNHVDFDGNVDVMDYDASFYNYSYNPWFFWNFGDGSKVIRFNQAYYQKLYNSEKEDQYNVTIYATNIISSQSTFELVNVRKVICNVQANMPWSYHVLKELLLSETVYFEPAIHINCPADTAIDYHWRFFLELPTNTSQFQKPFETSNITISIPAKTFGVGRWKYIFTVNTSRNASDIIEGAFIIYHSGLQALINGKNASYIIKPLNQSYVIHLNGSLSKDIDMPDEKKHLRYLWRCYAKNAVQNTNSSCFKSEKWVKLDMTNPILVVRYPDDLIEAYENHDKFLFVLEVSKTNKTTVNATIVYEFADIKESFMLDCLSCQKETENLQSPRIKSLFRTSDMKRFNTSSYSFQWSIAAVENYKGLYQRYKSSCMPNKLPISSSEFLQDEGSNYYPAYSGFNAIGITFEQRINDFICVSNATTKSDGMCHFTDIQTDKKCEIFIHNVTRPLNTTFMPGISNREISFASNDDLVLSDYTHSTNSPTTYQNSTWEEARIENYNVLDGYFRDRKKNWLKDNSVILPHGSKKNLLVVSNNINIYSGVLTPSQEYVVQLMITDKMKTELLVARSVLYFKADEIPIAGNCGITTDKILLREEFTQRFFVRCQNWKSKYRLRYILHALNPITETFELVLVTRKSFFCFMLPFYYHYSPDRLTMLIRVTIMTSTGDFTKLCNLKVDSIRNSDVNVQYLMRHLNDSKELLKPFDTNFLKFHILYNFLTKITYTKEFSVESSSLVRNKVCNLATQIYNDTAAGTKDQVSTTCVDWILDSTRELLLNNHHAILMHNGSFLHDHYTLIDDTFYVLQKVVAYYESKRNNHSSYLPLVINIQRDLLQLVSKVFYSDETYAKYESEDLSVFAVKLSASSNDYFQRRKYFADGDVYMKVTQTESSKKELESCTDLRLAFFGKAASYIWKVNYRKLDVHFSDCSNMSLKHDITASLRVPVHFEYYDHVVRWNEVNYHVFNASNEQRKISIYVKVNSESENSIHYKLKIELRKTFNETFYESVSYPTDCTKKTCLLRIKEDEKITEGDYYKLTITIQTSLEKVVDIPYYNYSVSVSRPECQGWQVDKLNRIRRTPGTCGVDDFASHTQTHIACWCSRPSVLIVYALDIPYDTIVEIVERNSYGSFTPIYMLTAALFLFMFLVLVYWSHKNFESEAMFELPENHPCDYYKYSILVETGFAYDAGTTARVCAMLYGTAGHSEKFELTHADLDIFQRSTKDAVFVSCSMHLGDLTQLLVWHDNKGSSPDWYIKQIVIKDLSTNIISYFPVNNWLSLARGLRNTCAHLIATNTSCHSRLQVIFEKTLDYHLWLSVFYGPKQTRFSTFERLCCLLETLVFYFGTTYVLFPAYMNTSGYLLDIHRASTTDVFYYSLLAIICHLPVKTLLSCFFRHSVLGPEANYDDTRSSKRKKGKQNKISCFDEKDENIQEYEMDIEDNETENHPYFSGFDDQRKYSSFSVPPVLRPTKRARCNFDLPRYYRWIGLILLFAIVSSGSVFVIIKSLSLNENLTSAWVQLLIISLMMDIFVVSVAEALLTSYAFAKFFGNRYSDIFNSLEKVLMEKRQLPRNVNVQSERQIVLIRHRSRFIRYAEPMKSHEIQKKRLKPHSKAVFDKAIVKIFIFLPLLLVGSIMCFQENITEVYQAGTFLKNTLNVTGIDTVDKFWTWSNSTISQLINYESWHQSVTTSDLPSRILGRAVLERIISNKKETAIFVRGKVSQLLETLKNKSWINYDVDKFVYRFTTIHFDDGKPLYSDVNISFLKHAIGVLFSKVQVKTFIIDTRTSVKDKGAIYLTLISLALLLIVLFVRCYNNLLQYEIRAFFNSPSFFDLFIFIMGVLIIVYYNLEQMETRYIKDVLSLMQFDYHGTKPIHLDLQRIAFLKQTFVSMKGLFIFLVSIKNLTFLKLHPVTYAQFKLLKSSLKQLRSCCLIFIGLFVLTCSNFWYLLFCRSVSYFVSYARCVVHVLLFLPRLLTNYKEIRDNAPCVYVVLSVSMAMVSYLFVRMSCIFFLGVFMKRKRQRMVKLVTFTWLTKRGLRYLKEFVTSKRKLGSKMKSVKGFSRVPKKYLFDEIDNQLDEVLYRINNLAKSQNAYISESEESETDSTGSYITEEASSASRPINDDYSRLTNTDGLSYTFNTNGSAVRRLSLTGRSSIIYVREKQPDCHLDDRRRSWGLFSKDDVRHHSSFGSFQRFSLASILENKAVFDKPLQTINDFNLCPNSATNRRNSRRSLPKLEGKDCEYRISTIAEENYSKSKRKAFAEGNETVEMRTISNDESYPAYLTRPHNGQDSDPAWIRREERVEFRRFILADNPSTVSNQHGKDYLDNDGSNSSGKQDDSTEERVSKDSGVHSPESSSRTTPSQLQHNASRKSFSSDARFREPFDLTNVRKAIAKALAS